MKKISTISGLIIIIISAAILLGGAFYFQNLAMKDLQLNVIQPVSSTAGWNTLNSKEYGFSLKYPSGFFDAGHEPKILVGNCNDNLGNCQEVSTVVAENVPKYVNDAGVFNWRDANGEKINLNNASYLLCQTGDAATGHVFNYYYYATVKNNKCLIINFDTSTANCDFYLPLEQGNTEQAKNYNNCMATNKSQPIILNEIVSTFKFTK